MSSFRAGLLVTCSLLLLPYGARTDDVSVSLGAGDDFVVEDSGSSERLRVEESTGTVHIGDAEIGTVGGPSNQGDIWLMHMEFVRFYRPLEPYW